ncbi:hypothetical protein R3P38DRAFT_3611562 [Favolaschia claudopus]|uniref:Uncharacterized protein n=1 Tax=Favolaschia claudopus TaxID=2862362 RepID=A0AAW0A4Z9_9AGAR
MFPSSWVLQYQVNTMAIMVGVVGDISGTRSDRGGFSGPATMGPMFASTLKPLNGGVFAGKHGWRSRLDTPVPAHHILNLLPQIPSKLSSATAAFPSPGIWIYYAIIPIILGWNARKGIGDEWKG